MAIGGYALLSHLADRGWIRKRFAVAVALLTGLGIAGSLGTATHFRNLVFQSQEGVWRDAAAKRPGNLRARTAVVGSLLKQGRFVEAERVAREILERADAVLASGKVRHAVAASNPRLYHSAAENQVGLALLGMKREEESLAHFSEAIRTAVGGHKGSYLFDRALAYRVLGRDAEALADLRTSLDVKPDAEKAHAMLGKILTETGQHREALDYYEKALRLAPGFEWVKVELAWLLATSPDEGVRDGERALKLVLRVDRRLRERSVRAMEALAAAYAATGEPRKAAKVLEAAARVTREAGQPAPGLDDTFEPNRYK